MDPPQPVDFRASLTFKIPHITREPKLITKYNQHFKYLLPPAISVNGQTIAFESSNRFNNLANGHITATTTHVHFNVCVRINNMEAMSYESAVKKHSPFAYHLRELKNLMFELLMGPTKNLKDICITFRLSLSNQRRSTENLNHFKQRLFAANIARFNTAFRLRGIRTHYEFEDYFGPIAIPSRTEACGRALPLNLQGGFTGETDHDDEQLIKHIDVYDVDISATDNELKRYFGSPPFCEGPVNGTTRQALQRLLLDPVPVPKRHLSLLHSHEKLLQYKSNLDFRQWKQKMKKEVRVQVQLEEGAESDRRTEQHVQQLSVQNPLPLPQEHQSHLAKDETEDQKKIREKYLKDLRMQKTRQKKQRMAQERQEKEAKRQAEQSMQQLVDQGLPILSGSSRGAPFLIPGNQQSFRTSNRPKRAAMIHVMDTPEWKALKKVKIEVEIKIESDA